MKKQPEFCLPDYLEELLCPTPSNTEKLIAAWDGLSVESQIQILSDKKHRSRSALLWYRIAKKAFNSDNAYVRYLAAEFYPELRESQDEYLGISDYRSKEELVANDPSPLVQYSTLESLGLLGTKDPERFFAQPQQARLAMVRKETCCYRNFANIITHAIDNGLKDGTVSETELWEILSDYLNKKAFKEGFYVSNPYDGWSEAYTENGLDTLWELVPKVPYELSFILIEQLPAFEIPKHVLDDMNGPQLEKLFYRQDVGFLELRKQIFFLSEDTADDSEESNHNPQLSKTEARSAAVCCNFDLSNEEFARILSKPDKQRVSDLKILSMSRDLRLCLYNAIHDALYVSKVNFGDFEDAWDAKSTLNRNLEKLKNGQRDKQVMELKLYRLAVRAVPWKKDEEGYPPSGELAFLENVVVEGDTWVTFMAFSDEWNKNYNRTDLLEKHLPEIREIDEENDIILDEDDVDDPQEFADRIAIKLSELLPMAGNSPEQSGSMQTDSIGGGASEMNGNELSKLKDEWISNRFQECPKDHRSQYNEILEELGEKVIDETLRLKKGKDTFCQLMSDAHEILDDVQYILTPQHFIHPLSLSEKPIRGLYERAEDIEKFDEYELEGYHIRRNTIWLHKDSMDAMNGGTLSNSFLNNFNPDQLSEQVEKYIHRPWLSGSSLEWVFVDALIYREVTQLAYAYKREILTYVGVPIIHDLVKCSLADIKKLNFKWKMKKFGWLFGICFAAPIALIWWLAMGGFGVSALIFGGTWIFCISLWFIISTGRWVYRMATGWKDPRKHILELWKKMVDVHKLLGEGFVHPIVLRNELKKTKGDGAVWPTSLYSLVNHIFNERYSYKPRW